MFVHKAILEKCLEVEETSIFLYTNITKNEFEQAWNEVKNRLYMNIIKEVGRRKHLEKYRGEMDFNFKIGIMEIVYKFVGFVYTTKNAVIRSHIRP